MPAELSISYLKPVSLLTIINAENQLDQSRPIQKLFPRVGHSLDTIELPIRQRRPNALPHTSRDGEASPINRGELTLRRYQPSWIKTFVEWSSSDLNCFTAADKALKVASPDASQRVALARAVEMAQEAARDMGTDIRTEHERLCTQALQGVITTKLADGSEGGSIDYGLTPITQPTVSWDNAAADIITDLAAARSQFKAQNPDGLPPTVVYYYPTLYERAFSKNTAWKEWKKANPDLAAGMLRLGQGINETNEDGYYVTKMFGMTWIAVDGTYRDLDGQVKPFWDENKLVLARPENAGFQWAMTFGHDYNPAPEIHFESVGPERPDVKTGKTFGYDNGLPLIKRPEFVQPWTVIHT